MTETTQQLARKLADHPRFRWMSGMRVLLTSPFGTVTPHRLYMGSSDCLCAQGEGDKGGYIAGFGLIDVRNYGATLDLDDPATVGCVEAQVRALAPRRRFVLYESNSRWILQLQSLECVVLWATGSTTRGAVWAAAFLDVALMDFVASPEVLAKSVSDK